MTGEQLNIGGDVDTTGKTRNCDHCGDEYTYHRKSSRFCSDACRVNYNVKNKGASTTQVDSAVKVQPPVLQLNGLDPKSQYIIHDLNEKVQHWKAEYERMRSDKKKLKEKNETLEKQLQKIEFDRKLEESARPSGLDGIMQSPFVEKLIENPHVGAALGKLIERFMMPGTPQIAGTDQAPVQMPDVVRQTIEMMASYPENVQNDLMTLMYLITQQPQEEVQVIVYNMINLLQQGSTLRTGTHG